MGAASESLSHHCTSPWDSMTSLLAVVLGFAIFRLRRASLFHPKSCRSDNPHLPQPLSHVKMHKSQSSRQFSHQDRIHNDKYTHAIRESRPHTHTYQHHIHTTVKTAHTHTLTPYPHNCQDLLRIHTRTCKTCSSATLAVEVKTVNDSNTAFQIGPEPQQVP
ncbi:hypothetical protein CF327_g3690 [Tilletia walkeri]|nr:hypothetical protein CF327_g3690 [Tilletia walkeri]